MTRLLLLCGSARQASFNLQLLRDLAQRLHRRCEVDLVDPAELSLPLFNEDLEHQAVVVAQVAALQRRILACDGLVVATPAYNGQLPPFLKNIVDWVSRLPHVDARFDNAFEDLPVLLCSATTGRRGAAEVIPFARALFGYVGSRVCDAVIRVPSAHEIATDRGFEFDPFFDEEIDSALEELLGACQRPACATARLARPQVGVPS